MDQHFALVVFRQRRNAHGQISLEVIRKAISVNSLSINISQSHISNDDRSRVSNDTEYPCCGREKAVSMQQADGHSCKANAALAQDLDEIS